MTTGDIMIYSGIGITAVSVLLLIVTSIIFPATRKKLEKKIFEDYEK